MANETTPADWPAWMAGWAIDVSAVLARETGGRAVAIGEIDPELDELAPRGFDLSEALRRFVGPEAAARVDEPPTVFAPRVSPPAPTPVPAGEAGIEPVATILAEQVEARGEAALDDLQLGAEPFPASSEARRRDDDLANLYDLAREEGGAEALINPDELPDLIDELMVNEEPALPLEPADPGQLTGFEEESSAAPTPPTEEAAPRAVPAAPASGPDLDILVEPASTSDFDEFDDYDLIDEDGDEAHAASEGSQRASALPTPVPGEAAPATAGGPHSEADSALTEIFGLARPSDAPPETLDSKHPPFEDVPALDEADETVDEATVVQQGPFSWDRVVAAQRKPAAAPEPKPSAPAIQPGFAPPPEPDDWFAAGSASQPAGAQPAEAGRASATPEEHDGQGRKRKSSFFRKLFGGGDDQK